MAGRYRTALNVYNHANPKPKIKPSPPPPIGLPPATPDPGTCAPAAAFGIQASSLPPGTTNTGATTPSTQPTGTATPTTPASSKPTSTTAKL